MSGNSSLFPSEDLLTPSEDLFTDVTRDFSSSTWSGSGLANYSNSTDLCLNISVEIFGHTSPIPRDPAIYISLGVLHLVFVVLPTLIFSPLAIYFMVKRGLSRHPTNIIFCWLCVVCIIGPCTYGLLMDFSLFFDVPLLGRCDLPWEGMLLWLCYACALTTYDFLLAFSAVAYYVSLRFNITRFSLYRLNAMLAGVIAAAVVVASFWLLIAEGKEEARCHIRGSFCVTLFGGNSVSMVVLETVRIACALVPLNVCVVISLFLYYKKVKSSVMEFDSRIQGAIMRLFAVLSLGSLMWNAPTLVMHFGSFDGSQRGFIEMLSTYTLQQNFTLFPLLSLFLNKDVRQTVSAYVCCCVKKEPSGVEVAEQHVTLPMEEVLRTGVLPGTVTVEELLDEEEHKVRDDELVGEQKAGVDEQKAGDVDNVSG